MTSQELNDRCDAAVCALSAGDNDALSTIYDLMARQIYVTAYAITANHADAEDALQDTILQIVKYAPSYRAGTSARAWMLTLARHRAVDIVRRRKSIIHIEDEQLASIADPNDSTEIASVWELLNALKEQERQLVILRLYDELSYAEIARVMGISVAAAEKRYQRALKKLKNAYLP